MKPFVLYDGIRGFGPERAELALIRTLVGVTFLVLFEAPAGKKSSPTFRAYVFLLPQMNTAHMPGLIFWKSKGLIAFRARKFYAF